MVSQAILIGIAVGVFFAGLGIGYAVFQSSPSSVTLTRQQMMSQMMSDPQAMTDWMNQMMSDPAAMNQMHQMMFQDPQHMNQMMGMMMQNNQFMHGMMTNPQFQKNWMGPWMMNNTNWGGMMGQGMMGPGMMMGSMMMGTPITKQADVLKTIDKIEDLLDQVSAKYRDGDSAGALSAATEAYLENYEYIEGAIADKDSALMSKVELMLRMELRHAINTNQSAEEIDSTIDSIKEELGNIRALF